MLKILVSSVVSAVLTSIFWLSVYAQKPAPPRTDGKIEAAGDKARVPGEGVTVAEGLVVGPAGLAIPVVGVKASQLTDTFTQARAGGARVHDAIDIMASEGTPVVAAAPGTVEKLFFSNGGGGITAYVRSDDKEWSYYYAHLQGYAPGLAEGQHLARGAAIGTVGHTGNASAEGPHLHFAVNRMNPGEKWYQGSPINPYPLLAGTANAR